MFVDVFFVTETVLAPPSWVRYSVGSGAWVSVGAPEIYRISQIYFAVSDRAGTSGRHDASMKFGREEKHSAFLRAKWSR